MRIFQAVAIHGSVSKAAKALNYVQSHVTARIHLLETTLQTQLFQRYSRGMILTSDGKLLLSYTEKILAMVDEMMKVMTDSNNLFGSLALGTVETVIKLPIILSSFHSKFPSIELSLVTGVTEKLIDDILTNKLDGAFVTGYELQQHKLNQYEVFHEDLVLISNREKLEEHDLNKEPILVFHAGCSYRSKLRSWLLEEGIIAPKILEFGTLETILGGVVSGLGISLVPKSSVVHLEEAGLIYCHSIPEKFSKITTVFIHNNSTYLTKSMEKFIETIKEYNQKEKNAEIKMPYQLIPTQLI